MFLEEGIEVMWVYCINVKWWVNVISGVFLLIVRLVYVYLLRFIVKEDVLCIVVLKLR